MVSDYRGFDKCSCFDTYEARALIRTEIAFAGFTTTTQQQLYCLPFCYDPSLNAKRFLVFLNMKCSPTLGHYKSIDNNFSQTLHLYCIGYPSLELRGKNRILSTNLYTQIYKFKVKSKFFVTNRKKFFFIFSQL